MVGRLSRFLLGWLPGRCYVIFLVCNIRHSDLCLKQKPTSVSSVIAHDQRVVGSEPKEKPLKTLPTLTGPADATMTCNVVDESLRKVSETGNQGGNR